MVKTNRNPRQRAALHCARRLGDERPSVLTGLLAQSEQYKREGRQIINLALGMPDYSPPQEVLAAAHQTLEGNLNSYGDSRGALSLRTKTAERLYRTQGVTYDPASEVLITGGASTALTAALLALVNPRDKVLVFEPYFENFISQLRLAQASIQYVTLHGPDWKFDSKELRAAFARRPRFVLLNTPHNPTGKVFTAEELDVIAFYCRQYDCIVLADETYEPFTYERPHVSIASLPGMRERTILIHSISKVLNVSGWRIGSICAAKALTRHIKRVNDMTLGAPVPLQEACAQVMDRFDAIMEEICETHRATRDQLCDALRDAGFQLIAPEGTMSVLADASELGFKSGFDCSAHLLNEHQILAAPGNAFYRPRRKTTTVRFSFARVDATAQAARLLRSIRQS